MGISRTCMGAIGRITLTPVVMQYSCGRHAVQLLSNVQWELSGKYSEGYMQLLATMASHPGPDIHPVQGG